MWLMKSVTSGGKPRRKWPFGMSSKTDDSPLRWGILGCGNISGDFVRAMTVCQHKNEIHGLAAASSLERAEVFRNEHFGADDSCVAIQRAKCHGSYAELLERKDIDVVYVGVANHLHKPVVLQAIEAGKHVVCEKPLALNRAEVAEMFERAKAKGVFLMERVKNTPREHGGGYLMASGCYAVMFAQFVFDEEKPEVIVANGQLDEKRIDLWASITLKYSGGRVANLFYHGLQETPCQASVNGPKGQLRLPEAFWSPSKLIVQSGGQEPKTHDHPLPATDLKFFFPNSVGLCYEADHVYECLKQGKLESPIMPPATSLRLVEILDEIRKQLGVQFPQDLKAANLKMVKLVETIAELRALVAAARLEFAREQSVPTVDAKTITFVPTMGALHDGHLELVRECRRRHPRSLLVVSIFVNPLQFAADGRDLQRYPRTLDADSKLLDGQADVVFAPRVDEVYPEGSGREIRVRADVDSAAQFEGKHRPGHFDGVLTVVAKLFNMVQPDVAAFGQKDAEQVFLISRMVDQLNFPVQILVVPTVREPDGLAMSSRNRLLTADERKTAAALPAALFAARDLANRGHPLSKILGETRELLAQTKGIRVDYVVAVDPKTMREVADEHSGPALLMAAVWVGETRLIDNLEIPVPSLKSY